MRAIAPSRLPVSDRTPPTAAALASPQGRRALWLLGFIACLKALGLILVAEGIAMGVVDLIRDEPIRTAVTLGALGALVRAGAVWASRTVGARAAVGVKTELRRALVGRVFAGSGRDMPLSDGALTLAATRSLDDLDDYFTSVLPALTGSAAIPLLITARIVFTDWVSAVILVLTLPLVPYFMVLIGKYTADRVSDATISLDRLSTNLVELARGLPVLVGLGRVVAQTTALRAMSQTYRDTTMQTLKVAFISALALEFIATISVAVVAVFIGVRLVYGQMELQDGLFALILAPECFLPLRQLGAAFHSTENGIAAFERIKGLIARPTAPARTAPAEAGDAITIDDLSVRYADRQVPALGLLDARIPSAGVTVLRGPSGAGKSTLLGVLAGLVREDEGCAITGTVRGVPAPVAYAGQNPRTFAPTVGEELRLYGPPECSETQLQQCLDRAALAVPLSAPCAALSPGEQRRLALARVFAAVAAGARLVLVDEPTAHLDADSARRVRESLGAVSAEVPVVAATHDQRLIDAAAHIVDIAPAAAAGAPLADAAEAAPLAVAMQAQPSGTAGSSGIVVSTRAESSNGATTPDGSTRDATRGVGERASADAAASGAASADAAVFDGSRASEASAAAVSGDGAAAPAAVPAVGQMGPDTDPAAPSEESQSVPLVTAWRRLVRAVDLRSPKMLLAVLCGVAAVAAGAALTGVSAWLIVYASRQPPIMYLLVAIVGVRFFGLSRSVLKYLERLVLHDAVLSSLADLRERIWLAFARMGTANRALLRGEVALSRLIADVDDIRDLAPRVVLPPIVAVVVAVAAVVTLGLIHPAAAVLMAVAAVLCLVLAPALTLWADGHATSARLRSRNVVLSDLAALLWAREDLLVGGSAPRAVRRFLRADALAGSQEAAALRATGIGEAVITLLGVLAGVLMLPVLAGSVSAGELSGELLAVAVLLPLALIDCFIDSLAALQQWPALRQVLGRVTELDDTTAPEDLGGDNGPDEIGDLELRDLAARWPGAEAEAFSGVSTRLETGEWLAVTGPSGSGKTTLVSVLLRFLNPSRGEYRINGEPTAELLPMDLAGLISWCPQEAHVFDSSLRANLLVSRPKDDAPDEEELHAVLDRVGLGELAADVGMDAKIGASGAHLSGGQRQRLAVARTLLARADVIVLDEPTAHLDQEMSSALMGDLRTGLGDTSVVLVTHDEGIVKPDDRRVRLG
ncbi:hypothetical protein GCM10022261_28300 [Brevibacterium daeguense]|uniref:Thiol reductant ABC exporter subunit CydD n=1 Tax=Brevibacterium daeguense TaxID=909936 RepID=A0ABP8EMZ9_9MICO|nr:thiol reductant ABC exporter subunit CydD [Brevibacterium daeguense]